MEINNLLESSNNYKSMLADSQKLANKWQDSGLLEGIEDNRVKNNMAMILENQAKQIVAEANVTGTGGSFTAGEGEQWAGVALPLVRKVFAQIVAQDFVSVQPMNLPSGLVFYLDFKYGSNLSGRTAGTNMYGNVSSASNKMSVDEEVSGGLYGAGQFGYSMKSASVAFQADTGSATSASIAYNDDLVLDQFKTVTKSLSGLSADLKGVRAFRFFSGSTDVTSHPELTTVSGNNVTFVITASNVTAAGDGGITGSVMYYKQPADNSRGDFEASSTAAVDPQTQSCLIG